MICHTAALRIYNTKTRALPLTTMGYVKALTKGKGVLSNFSSLSIGNERACKAGATPKSCAELLADGWKFDPIPIYEIDDDVHDMMPWLGGTEDQWHETAYYCMATFGHEPGKLARVSFYNVFYSSGVIMALENFKAEELRGQAPYWSDIV